MVTIFFSMVSRRQDKNNFSNGFIHINLDENYLLLCLYSLGLDFSFSFFDLM